MISFDRSKKTISAQLLERVDQVITWNFISHKLQYDVPEARSLT